MTHQPQSADFRSHFLTASQAFITLVKEIPEDAWNAPALGVWTVRDLVGHASRAISTVEDYLARDAAGPAITDPVEYFLLALADADDPARKLNQDAAIASRGVEAGLQLGKDPAKALEELAARVGARVQSTGDSELLGTPVGPMTLAGYLPTRTFELAVHGCDLARALDVSPPGLLHAGIASACELAGRIAARRSSAASLLLLITGRTGLPKGTGIL